MPRTLFSRSRLTQVVLLSTALCAAAVGARAADDKVLSLQDVAGGVLRHWPDVQKQKFETEAAGYVADKTRAQAYGPNVSLSGQAGYESRRYNFSGPGNKSDYGRAEVGVEVAIPLVDFGAGAGRVRAAESRAEEACYAFDQTALDLLQDTVLAYAKVLELRQTIGAIDQALPQLEDIRGRMAALLKVQGIAPAVVADHGGRISQLRLLRNNAETELRSVEIKLSMWYGENFVNRPLQPAIRPKVPAGSVRADEPAGEIVAVALENSPAYQKALAAARTAQAEMDAVHATRFGAINLRLDGSTGKNAGGDLNTRTESRAMVEYRLPIDVSGAMGAEERSYGAKYAGSTAEADRVRLQVQGQLRTVLYRLAQSEVRLEQSANLLLARSEQTKNIEEEVKVGSKTLGDLGSSVTGLIDAKVESFRAANQNTEMAYHTARAVGVVYNTLAVEADVAALRATAARSPNLWETIFFWQGIGAPDVSNCTTRVVRPLDVAAGVGPAVGPVPAATPAAAKPKKP